MTLQLSEDLEQFVRDAVRAGRYASDGDVVRDALDRLRQSLPEVAAKGKTQPLSPDELNRRLLAAGLVTQLPDPAQDIEDDADPPIVIEGEPLSETILRERR